MAGLQTVPGIVGPFAGIDVPWLLRMRAESRSEHPFLVWAPFDMPARRWSYGEFHSSVGALAAGLSRRGIKPGDYVGTRPIGFVQPAGTVGATFTGAGDPSIVVKYPQGEKRIIIPANAHVVRNAFGSKDDLKAGAAFRAQAATKQPDGTFTASAITVGRDGARPF